MNERGPCPNQSWLGVLILRAAIVEREDTIFVVVGAGFKSESRPASIRNIASESAKQSRFAR
jgi:hypothetical protein